MNVRKTVKISMYADEAIVEYLKQQAGQRRMDLSAFCMKLIARGLATNELVDALDEMKEIARGDIQREMLRQVLATRYIAEATAKGEIRLAHMIGSHANEYADKQIEKLWPKGEGK